MIFLVLKLERMLRGFPKIFWILKNIYIVIWIKPGKFVRKFFGRYGVPITINQYRLQKIKEKYRGKRIFIIGNGPSLTIQDLEKLKGEITIGTNKIYLCFSETDWRPTIYCSEDPLILQKQDHLNSILPQDMLKLLPRKSGVNIKLPNAIFFDLEVDKFYKKNALPKFGTNPMETLYWGSTVTYTCIQLAHYLGAKDIYLLGVDFNYNVYGHQKEGDSVFISDGKHLNHFHPDYDKEGEKFYPPNLDRHEFSLKAVVRFQEGSNLSVYNATRGGKLELFQRVDLDAILLGERKQSPHGKLHSVELTGFGAAKNL